jgi:hypothetical protein
MTFRLRWEKSMFHNPVDGRTYQCKMNVYQPVKGTVDPRTHFRPAAATPKSHVEIVTIIMLKEPTADVLSPEVLSRYGKEIRATLRTLIPRSPPLGIVEPCQRLVLDLQVPPPPDGGLPIGVHPSAAGVDLPTIAAAVMRIPLMLQERPRTNAMLFRIQLVMGLWGYDGEDLHLS